MTGSTLAAKPSQMQPLLPLWHIFHLPSLPALKIFSLNKEKTLECWNCFKQDKNPESRANVLKSSFTIVSLVFLGVRFLLLKVMEKIKALDHRGASRCSGEGSVYVLHHLWILLKARADL